jgi:hypothetical protein
MSGLDVLQRAFQDYVLHGTCNIQERVASADPKRRLRIYYDAYRLRLLEALATDYEALRAYLGEDAFAAACGAYIERNPSTVRNVRWYGAGLPGFLRDTEPFSQQRLLADLAWFEWSLTLAFDALDQPPLAFDHIAAIPADAWPTLRFMLHPGVQLIELHTNAPAFRKAHDAGEPWPSLLAAAARTPWLIWRSDHTSCFRSLSEPEAWALRAVRNDADFTALCEGLCDWLEPEEAAPHAAGYLRQWIDDGLIMETLAD